MIVQDRKLRFPWRCVGTAAALLWDDTPLSVAPRAEEEQCGGVGILLAWTIGTQGHVTKRREGVGK